jgi:glucosamine--fructose-6-phosphate aminotransferase (isomerizing)
MCGIVGYVGPQEASPLLLEGLRRLEYRGYDSAGIATLSNGGFEVYRSPGKLGNLVEKLSQRPASGATGIGHTFFVNDAAPTEINAHPQTDCTGQIVVVHNGIFENFAERKAALKAAGHRFRSETDTEVFAHEIEAAFQGDLLAAVRAAVSKLTGAYAVLIASSREPGVLVAARSGPPIVLGLGEGENFVASDPVALVPWTRDVVFLEDGDVARVDAKGVRIVDTQGRKLDREVHGSAVCRREGGCLLGKGITTAVAGLGGQVSGDGRALPGFPLSLARGRLRPRLLLACGTSWHSAQVGKF